MSLLDAALLIQGAFFFALAGLALHKGPRQASMRITAVFAAFWGYASWMFAIPSILAAPPLVGTYLFITGIALWDAILLSVAIIYPATRVVGWRRIAVVSVWGIPLGYVLGVVAFRSLFIDPTGNLGATGTAFVFGMHAIPLAAPMVVFGLRWLREERPTIRTQMAYATAGFMITNLNDAATHLPGFNMAVGAASVPLGGISGFFAVLNVLRVAVFVAFAVIAFVRLFQSRFADRGALFMAAAALIAIALTPLQRLDSDVHILVDGLAFFLAFYGLARSLALEFDIGLGTRAGRTVLFGSGITLLFIVQQSIEQFVGSTFGILTGAIVAGLSLALLAPMGSMLDRLRREGSITPRDGGDAYAMYRRIQIYRTALEGALHDGTLDPTENRILANLRRDLVLTMDDHDRLVQAIRTGQ